MIYRKTPLQPPRLLLRIVAGAGAGVLLGTAACGSNDSGHQVNGLVAMLSSGSNVGGGTQPNTPDDSGSDGLSPAMPSDAGEEAAVVGGGVSPCHPCGAVVLPHDSGTDATDLHGVVPFDDGGVLGVVIMPGGGLQPAPEDAGQMMTGLVTDQ
jgi:hypothetical protein